MFQKILKSFNEKKKKKFLTCAFFVFIMVYFTRSKLNEKEKIH